MRGRKASEARRTMEQTEERTVSRWGDAGRRAEAHADARADVRRADTREAAHHADAHKTEAIAPTPLRVLIVAPSHDILGGQSIHAAQLVREFGKEPSLRVCVVCGFAR